MIFDFLFKKKDKGEYALLVRGKERVRKDPLPVLFPGLFIGKPDDKYASFERLKNEASENVTQALHKLRIPVEMARNAYMLNIERVLRLPVVYKSAVNLSRKCPGLASECHMLATGLQACASFGDSDIVGNIQENLMPMLLGLYSRYYACQYIKSGEFAAIGKSPEEYPQDGAAREAFIGKLKNQKKAVCELSRERFIKDIGDCALKNRHVKQVLDIILYTNRLMGDGAMELDHTREQEIDQAAGYIGMLQHIYHRNLTTNKRVSVLLAEEYELAREHRKAEGLEKTARHNIFAIQDLMAAHRCHFMEYFQGKDDWAIYCEPENIIVKKSPDARDPSGWACYRPEKPLTEAQREKRKTDSDRNKAKHDPSDEHLAVRSVYQPD